MAVEKLINIVIEAVDKTERGFTRPIKSIEDLKKSAADLKPAFTLAASAFAAASVAMVASAIDTADAVNTASKATGISTEALSAWGHVADQNGSSAEALFAGLKKMNLAIAEAGDASSEKAEAFKALGVETRNASGEVKSGEEVFRDLVSAFSKLEDGPAKAALQVKIFGKAGAELNQVLSLTPDQLKAAEAQAAKLGITISSQTAQAADDFNDSLDLMKKQAQGLALRVAGDLLPSLNTVSEAMADSTGFADGLAIVFKTLIATGLGVAHVINQIGSAIGAVMALAAAVPDGIGAVRDTWNAAVADMDRSDAEFQKRMVDFWNGKAPEAVEEGAKKGEEKRAAVDLAAVKRAEENAKKRAEAERKAIDEVTAEYNKATATKLALIDLEYDAKIAKLRAEFGETARVQAAIADLEYMRAQRLEEAYEAEREQTDQLKQAALEASGEKLAAFDMETAARRESIVKSIEDEAMRAEALKAFDEERAVRRVELEKETQKQIADVQNAAAEMHREITASHLEGYEAERAAILEQYEQRRTKIAELEEAGLASHEANMLRYEAEKAKDAELWQAKLNTMQLYIAARKAAEDALTAGMVAGVETLFAKQTEKEAALENQKRSVRSRLAALEEQQMLASMTAEERKAYQEKKTANEIEALRKKQHELDLKRYDRTEEAIKSAWLTFRDSFKQAMLEAVARMAAQLIIAKATALILASIWSPAAAAASVATLGAADATGAAAYAGTLAFVKGATTAAAVAHDGVGFVPNDETFFLKQGERVIAPKQNEDLTEFLDGGTRAGARGPVQVSVHLDGRAIAEGIGEMSRDGRLTISAGAIS